MLENFSIILIETSHPGNLGSVARGMMNMGLSDLRLVNPQTDHHAPEAHALATGAVEILEKARLYPTLADALSGVHYAVGTSARVREIALPTQTPRALFESAAQQWGADSKVAVVFGRERNGLTNAELDMCQYHAIIPTSEQYASLNLAMAVTLFSYEIRQAFSAAAPMVTKENKIAQHDKVQAMLDHAHEALSGTELTKTRKSERLMTRLKHIFARAQLTPEEVDLLRGIWRLIERLKIR